MEPKRKLRVGYSIPQKKVDENLHNLLQIANGDDRLVMSPINYDGEGGDISGDFDVVLCKATGDLTKKDDKEAEMRVKSLEKYFDRHPSIVQIDPLESQRKTIDREVMLRLLDEVERQLPEDLHVRNPRSCTFLKEQVVYDVKDLRFPLVCKTTQAGGSASAHRMGIVFKETGLHYFTPPMVAQEFYSHNSTLFKVFVIGDFSAVVSRDSLPDLPADPNTSTLFFDSQKPLRPQLEKVVKPLNDHTPTPQPQQEVVEMISKALSKHFGLSLFGYDMIVETETGRLGIIDINYFPGFMGVENFEHILIEFLLSKGTPRQS